MHIIQQNILLVLTTSQKKKKLLIIMQLNIKPNISLKFIMTDILNMSHKKELFKELNTNQLKDKYNFFFKLNF